MRVLHEVVVDRTADDELLVLSEAPGVLDDEMFLDLLGSGCCVQLRVRVLESRPVIVNERLRHRLRVAIVSAEQKQADPVAGEPASTVNKLAEFEA